jgi:chaperonin cofactor prefoldin
MRGLLENGTREEALGSRMEEFRAQMSSLDRKIESLAAEINAFKANNVQ